MSLELDHEHEVERVHAGEALAAGVPVGGPTQPIGRHKDRPRERPVAPFYYLIPGPDVDPD